MKQLWVQLRYGTTDLFTRGPGLVLPVKALDADGSVLAEGAASAQVPAIFELPDSTRMVFVRLAWPSGRFETQRVTFAEESTEASVAFTDDQLAAHEWSAWAVPKLNPKTPLAMRTSNAEPDLNLNRYQRTWLRLWKFTGQAWVLQKLKPQMTYRSAAAWRVDFALEPLPWMLQIGGSNVTWRFVSLPGGGPARVLITPKDSTDPRADALKVVVSSFRTDAETLLEFLSRDAMHAAEALASSATLAQQLFAEKFTDPVSAVAGAYYLLRFDQWERVPLFWFENLSNAFRWLPDAAVIHCARLLRGGLSSQDTAVQAQRLFAESLKGGWPVYAEGIALLQEIAALLSDRMGQELRPELSRVRDLGAARSWAGAAASFYGRAPDRPSPLQWVGMPRAPRRRRLDPALRIRRPQRASALDELPAALETSRLESLRTLREPSVQARLQEDEFLLGNIVA